MAHLPIQPDCGCVIHLAALVHHRAAEMKVVEVPVVALVVVHEVHQDSCGRGGWANLGLAMDMDCGFVHLNLLAFEAILEVARCGL